MLLYNMSINTLLSNDVILDKLWAKIPESAGGSIVSSAYTAVLSSPPLSAGHPNFNFGIPNPTLFFNKLVITEGVNQYIILQANQALVPSLNAAQIVSDTSTLTITVACPFLVEEITFGLTTAKLYDGVNPQSSVQFLYDIINGAAGFVEIQLSLVQVVIADINNEILVACPTIILQKQVAP